MVLAHHRVSPKNDIRLTSELDALVRIGHVDLPDGPERMVRIANSDQGKPHTSAMLLSRPATWREDPAAVLEFRRQLLEYLADQDRFDEIPPWSAAAALGYALLLQPHLRRQAVADQFVSAIMTIGPERAPTPQMLDAVRSTLRPAGLDPTVDDPLPLAATGLRNFIVASTDIPASLASPIVARTFIDLDENDRRTVLDAIITQRRSTRHPELEAGCGGHGHRSGVLVSRANGPQPNRQGVGVAVGIDWALNGTIGSHRKADPDAHQLA